MKKIFVIIKIILPPIISFYLLKICVYIICAISQVYIKFAFCFMMANKIPNHEEILAIDFIGKFPFILDLIVFLVYGIIYGLWIKRLNDRDLKSKETVKIKLKDIIYIIFLGIGCIILQVGAANLVFFNFKDIVVSYNFRMKHLEEIHITTIIKVVVFASISEELLFRGIIMRKLKEKLPFTTMNIIQAFIFAIVHGNIVQVFYTFGSGLLLGYVANRYSSVTASIILHSILNLLNYSIIKLLNYLVYMTDNSILYLLFYIAIGGIILWITIFTMQKDDALNKSL